ncbi:MAG: hypothetical protein QS748_02220 [Candidatus Endonucleobacter bathymodioli]|uniref:Uncharacterized protein n=1 Tax=Candidatus Endonucleibacter bathymodioli TaxID=539814 RepID=A0AA90NJK6_9GAMM|nr:hypothetical protein [Candidatus Endonucleobacter bathymodioli]
MVKHIYKKYMEISFLFYKDDSRERHALNWHRDCWMDSKKNPEFLAFAVLDVTLPMDTNATPPSKIKLGSINERYKEFYYANRPQLREAPSYLPMKRIVLHSCNFDARAVTYLSSIPDTGNCAQDLIELKNCTGTGYIANQLAIIDGRQIVHSRDARPYTAVVVSMVARCFCSNDKKEMMEDSEYLSIKDIGDKNMYIAVPSVHEGAHYCIP